MANLKRSAKSSSSWGINELIAYNIGVNIVIFGSPNFPQLTVSPVIPVQQHPPLVLWPQRRLYRGKATYIGGSIYSILLTTWWWWW